MTLAELWLLIRKYWWLAVGLPVVLAVGCFGVMHMMDSGGNTTYTATTTVVVNSQTASIIGCANNEFAMIKDSESDGKDDFAYDMKAEVEKSTNNVQIAVTGPDEAKAIDISLQVAEAAVARTYELYKSTQNSDYKLGFEAQILDTISEDTVTSKSVLKYTLVAFLAGLFLAICIIVVIDMVRRPIVSPQALAEAFELPVLAKLPVKDKGERLLANIRFAAKKDEVETVCVIPVGSSAAAQEVCALLTNAAASAGDAAFKAECQPSIAETIEGAYAAKKADATVLVACQWSDSMKAAEEAVAELTLADANLAGMVFAPKAN